MQKTFHKSSLQRMNRDPKYGYNWIKNLENVRSSEEIKLYPTGHVTKDAGRLYIAFPAKKILTEEETQFHNIINLGKMR